MTGRAVALTVAGSDSGGGAGIVADVRTFTALGVWSALAITAVTAQHAGGVQRVDVLDPALVRAQIDAVAAGLEVAAVKTGMLGNAAVAAEVASALASRGWPVVVDPVMVSTSGTVLLRPAGVAAVRERLLPMARLVTPNLAEAAVLTGRPVGTRDEMERAARALVALGCQAALVTGGHLGGAEVADCLVVGEGEADWITGPRVVGDGHGSGCVLSAAITAELARGDELADACRAGVAFVRGAIAAGSWGSVDPGGA